MTDTIELIGTYGYAVIFPITIIAGPIVAIVAGFMASLGNLNIFLAFLVLLAGDIAGDTFYYAIGKWGRYGFIQKWGKYIGISNEKLLSMDAYFQKHDWKILAFGKTHPIGSAILVAGGIAKMPYGKFMLYNILATIPKIILLELIGYYFGDAYNKINNVLSVAGVASLAIAIVLIGIYFLGKSYYQKKSKNIGI